MDGTSPVTRIYHEIWSNSDSDNNKPYTYAFSSFLFAQSTEGDGSDSTNPLSEPALTACNTVITPSLWTQENSFTPKQQEFCHALFRIDLPNVIGALFNL